MRPVDFRYYVIAVLLVCAGVIGYYRLSQTASLAGRGGEGWPAPLSALSREKENDPSAARVRMIIDTTARALGAPRRFILARTASDSGRSVPELAIGVPAAFDDLRMIGALTDSLRPFAWSVSAVKSLKEKTTTIRLRDRRHECMYRCLLYRKELSH